MPDGIPVVDLGAAPVELAAAIDAACRTYGFFTLVGHGVDPALAATLDREARAFFALPEAAKAEIAMARGGRAWRGWFPLGGELTAGVPDAKEGLYFGSELPADDPRVAAGLPLHGPNLFPAEPAGLAPAVLAWLDALTGLGHRVMAAIAMGVGLDAGWFERHLTADPTILFRIFRYPPATGEGWGVAEHTDYGLLTLLHQDAAGGLEVHGPDGWVEVPPVEGAFVCNLGDMLERMTGGAYRSTPHRVRNPSGADRVSLAFFFDPSWDAEVVPVPVGGGPTTVRPRWDDADPLAFRGRYGDYLVAKVTRVFPKIAAATGIRNVLRGNI